MKMKNTERRIRNSVLLIHLFVTNAVFVVFVLMNFEETMATKILAMAWIFSYWIPLYSLIRSKYWLAYLVVLVSMPLFLFWTLPFNPDIDEEVAAIELGFASFVLTLLVIVTCHVLQSLGKSTTRDDQ